MNTRLSFSKLKLVFSVIVVFCLIAGPVMAQDTKTPVTQKKPAGWALQFKISDEFRLSSYLGSTFSISKRLSPGRNLRVGLTLNGGRFDIDSVDTETVSENDYYEQSSADETHNGIAWTISSQYIREYRPNKKLKPFVGVGPFFRFSHSSNDNEKQDEALTQKTSNNTYWFFGLQGVWGMEWFVSRNISLLAEYGSSLGYMRQKYDSHTEQTNENGQFEVLDESESTSTGYQLYSGNVNFGVSIHF